MTLEAPIICRNTHADEAFIIGCRKYHLWFEGTDLKRHLDLVIGKNQHEQFSLDQSIVVSFYSHLVKVSREDLPIIVNI